MIQEFPENRKKDTMKLTKRMGKVKETQQES